VVLIDSHAQPARSCHEATDRMARGAVQVAQTLRQGDRAGIVALGNRRIQWLGADWQGPVLSIVDTILDRDGQRT